MPFTSQHWLWTQGTFILDLDHTNMLDLWAKPMEFSKPPPPSPLSQRDNSESFLENELVALCRGVSTVSLPHGNVCCLASIFKRSEACSGCSERRFTPIQSPTDFPPLKNRSVWQSAHMPLPCEQEGSHQQEVGDVHFLRLFPFVLTLHPQGCPGSGAIRNDLCQRAHYKNHLSLLVPV